MLDMSIGLCIMPCMSNVKIWCACLIFSLAACSDDEAQEIDAGARIDATGVADSGAADSGAADSGVADSGVADSGVADSGVADSGVADSSVADASICPNSLEVLDDNSGANGAIGLPDLVMSEINPGDYIELFNTTAIDIDLGAVQHQLCSPFSYVSLVSLAPTTVVPAGGFATVPWPVNFVDVDAGGEVILYASSSFGTDTAILDFVCWGTNPHGSRKSQAETVGKWLGACSPAISNSALHRTSGATGAVAASYNTADPASPLNCSP